jgi:hypothetical protein
MSWRLRYKNIYKTSHPCYVIAAVSSFPNLYDTLEKNIEYYDVKNLQSNPMELQIQSLFYLLEGGRDFIPIYFSDDVPKLEKLDTSRLSKGMFWCIGYRNPVLMLSNSHRELVLPTHREFKELLEYSLDHMNGRYCEFLFKYCIDQYVYKETENWTELQKSRRFKLICNTTLNFLNIKREKYDKNEVLEFIDNMYKRDIYEFIVNEYK